MKKDFLTLLREEVANHKGITKAVVFACRDDIQTGREAGYSLKQIWTALTSEKKVNGRYDCFARAVKAYLDNQK